MASDGRNQPLPGWSQREPGRADPDPFPPPDVTKVTLPGIPPGLFARATLDADVALAIPAWSTIPTDPSKTEKIEVQLARPGTSNYETVDTVVYIPSTTPLPLAVKIPSVWLLKDENEGPFNLRYKHENYFGTPSNSLDVPVFIDKVPPNGTAAPGKLTYAFTPPITDAVLNGLTDLEFVVPPWTGAAEGDKVAYTVVEGKLPDDPYDIIPVGTVELGEDRVVKFPVADIKKLRDGDYCFGYVIVDKALNRSRISDYDLIPLALGAFPIAPFPPLSVPEAADGVVDRADATQGVYAEFFKPVNAKATDTVAIIWGGQKLSYQPPIGPFPPRVSIAVDWAHMKDMYGAETGPVETDVEYKLYRGSVELGGTAIKVSVDFSQTGPVNPDPEPGNPGLHPVEVFGESGDATDTPNKLIAADENKPVLARITLYDPLADGDELQVLWNGVPIGNPHPIDIDNEKPGDEIDIDITDWAIIRKEGNNLKMPVTYRLTNPDSTNPQEPKVPTEVEITFLTITLPVAVPQDLVNGRLTCLSLHFEGEKIGFRYLIPPSEYLKEGMTVALEWKAYHTYATPVLVPGAGKIVSDYGPITQDEAENGFFWFIEPYATHLLPTWNSPANQSGKGEVIYTLVVGGVPVPSVPSDTEVGLTQGNSSCDLIPPPKP